MRQRGWMCLLMLVATTAWAADVTGKWTGSMVMDNGDQGAACLRLKQTGGAITGTGGPSEESQFPITTGRIDGEQVTIEARPGAAVLRLTMKLDGNKLTGEVFEDDQKIGTISIQKQVQ
jgi:hypothetical protein